MVFLCWHGCNPSGQKATIEVMDVDKEIQLSVIRLCGLKILLYGTLDMNESPYLIIGYLLKDECGGLGI